MDDCIFCKVVRGDLPSEKVLESENFIVIKDVNPKVEGHLLVVSKEHYDTFLGVPDDLYKEFLGVVKTVVKDLDIRDFNLVLNNGKAAGLLIFHFHTHILPRREGDGFSLGI